MFSKVFDWFKRTEPVALLSLAASAAAVVGDVVNAVPADASWGAVAAAAVVALARFFTTPTAKVEQVPEPQSSFWGDVS
jgi:hypothetical protein